jgi:hypothetical protein
MSRASPGFPPCNRRSDAVRTDGRPFSWDEVGRMLMTFEGSTLHARVEDSIEIVGGPLLEERDPDIRP